MKINFGRRKDSDTAELERLLRRGHALYTDEAKDEYIMELVRLVAAGCRFFVPIERLDNDDPGWVAFGALHTIFGKCIPVFTSKKEYDKGPDDCEMISLDIRTIIYNVFGEEGEVAGLMINPFGLAPSYISKDNLGVILVCALKEGSVPNQS